MININQVKVVKYKDAGAQMERPGTSEILKEFFMLPGVDTVETVYWFPVNTYYTYTGGQPTMIVFEHFVDKRKSIKAEVPYAHVESQSVDGRVVTRELVIAELTEGIISAYDYL